MELGLVGPAPNYKNAATFGFVLVLDILATYYSYATPWVSTPIDVPIGVKYFMGFVTVFATFGGMISFFMPTKNPICNTETWKSELYGTLVAPNSQSWGIRNSCTGLILGLALFLDCKSGYVTALSVQCWREMFDIYEEVR
jgi:hypothetical protein